MPSVGPGCRAGGPGPLPPTAEVLGPWRPFQDPASIWLDAACLPYAPDAEMPDTFFAEEAGRFLASGRSRPFFLWVGTYVTHSPSRPPTEFAGRFDPSALIPRMPGVIAPGRSTDAMVELVDVVPTVLDLCGVAIPPGVQGRSMARLARGETGRHRDFVVAEYADNAEAMVRDDRWKLVDSAGDRRRRDGYALGPDPPGQSIRLHDLRLDPGEATDVAGRAETADVVAGLLARLADHVRRTERDPGRVPETDDVHEIPRACPPPAESRG